MPAIQSLWSAVDAVNDAFFFNRDLSKPERVRFARAIAEQQGQPGAYANTFALGAPERKNGIKLFTGERTQSAAARHIAGEEACRALRLLNVRDKQAAAALDRATTNLLDCLNVNENGASISRFSHNPGTFCCGRCSVAVWRNAIAGGLDRQEERLARGVARLRDFRSAANCWTIFPFWYTVLALTEIDLPAARAELRRAETYLTRAAAHSTGSEPFATRRQQIARRALKRL